MFPRKRKTPRRFAGRALHSYEPVAARRFLSSAPVRISPERSAMTKSDHPDDRPARRDGGRRALVLGAVALGAAAGFAALNAAVVRRETAEADEKVRRRAAP